MADTKKGFNFSEAYIRRMAHCFFVACIDAETFAANLPRFFFVYIVGSLVFNGVCILLMKPAKALAAKTVKA